MERNTQDSKLNADAQEWIPRANNAPENRSHTQTTFTQPSKNPAQDRMLRIRAGQDPTATQPMNFITQQNHQHVDLPQKQDDDIADLPYLQGIIVRITADPGHFEEVIDIFMQTLHQHLNNPDMMQRMCTFIFQWAIAEASFRYNAARLCTLIQDESDIFRQFLNDLCVREVEKNKQQPGFTLFLAELNSMCSQGNWKMLYNAVNKLIMIGGDENIKTVCQTLKLAGYDMENFNKHLMAEVVENLEQQVLCVQKNIKALIETVLDLKEQKWGRAQQNANMSNISHSNMYANMPETFYGPSGEELSEAERRFLQGDMEEFDDPDELYDPEPEMDEEIQAAFREFVKLGK